MEPHEARDHPEGHLLEDHAGDHSRTARIIVIAQYIYVYQSSSKLVGHLFPQAREETWKRMTLGARTQFLWPDPGLPRIEDNAPYEQVRISFTP